MFKNHPGVLKSVMPTMHKFMLVALVLALPIATLAQTSPNDDPERARAFRLYDENKYTEVIPILEKLLADNPSDILILERLGWATFVVSGSTKDPEARKKARARALGYLTRAKDLGDDSELLRAGLDGLALPDPGDTPLSKSKEADTALREGEEAHARGELDKAIEGYKRAFQLDPKLYLAPLFVGDMYFKKGYQATDLVVKKQLLTTAGEWFGRAIAIDENVETGHRYWGDALKLLGDREGAKAKFIDGIIAEPFNRTPYAGLMQWAEEFSVNMSHPEINLPEPAPANTVDPKTSDPKQGPDYYWSFYNNARAAYKAAAFQKDHAGEKEYRHSLLEEAGALRAVAEVAAKDLRDGKIKALDKSLDNLVKLHQANLIEAYVFFVLRDEGIATDYAGYRQTNRDKLRKYWNDFVIAK